MKLKYLILAISILLPNLAFSADFGDMMTDKASKIRLSDPWGFFGASPAIVDDPYGRYASPPNVQSALMELGASQAVVDSTFAKLDGSNQPFTGTATAPIVVATSYASAPIVYADTITSTSNGAPNFSAGLTASYLNAVPGGLSESVVTNSAYSGDIQNIASFANNHLVTYNGNQYIAYWDSNDKLVMGFRTLTNNSAGTWTTYTYDGTGGRPNIALTGDDGHDIISFEFDKNGYCHLCYDMHAGALLYRVSSNPNDVSNFGATASMLGTNETAVTYPTFIRDKDSGELYFFFRDGSTSNADWYFYHYATATTSWEKSTGTGLNGLLINGKASPIGVYPNGLPEKDPSGNYIFTWCYRGATASDNQDIAYTKWNGTSFLKFDGSAQTIPITQANDDVVVTINVSTGYSNTNHMAIDSDGNAYVAYLKNDSAGFAQYFVSYVSAGIWTTKQLTNSKTVAWTTAFTGRPEIVIDDNDYVYIICNDVWKQGGISVIESRDSFGTWNEYYIYQGFTGYTEVTKDVSLWQTQKILSFIIQSTKNIINSNLGIGFSRLSVLNWEPLEGVRSYNGNLTGGNLGVVGNGVIMGALGIGTSSLTSPLTILDNGTTSNYILGVYADDQTPFIAGFFNNTYSTTVPGLEYFIYDTGECRIGTPGATSLSLYTNAYTNPRLTISSAGNISVPDNATFGLGSTKARIEFDDAAIDEINFLPPSSGDPLYIGLSTSTPSFRSWSNPGSILSLYGEGTDLNVLEFENTLSANATVGVIAWHNLAIGGADNRIAQINGNRSDANNSGSLTFLTWNAGSAVTGLTLAPSGNATFVGTLAVNGDTITCDSGTLSFDNENLTTTGTLSSGIITTTGRAKGLPHHLRVTIIDPLSAQTEDNEICIWGTTDAALTVTRIIVTLDASANEVAGDLKYADTFIGLANATVINVFDTASGVLDDSSITSGAVAAGKAIYIAFDSAPNTAIKQMNIDIVFDYD